MRVLIILLFISTISYGQESILLKDGKIKYSKPASKYYNPLGKDVTMSYDEFFKTYIVAYTDINGYRNEMKFVFNRSGLGIGYTYNGKKYVIRKNEGEGIPIGRHYKIIAAGIEDVEEYIIYDFTEMY